MKAKLLSLIALLTFSICAFAIDVDKTALVPTTWGNVGEAGAWAAPFVSTADGRTNVAMRENYNAGTADNTGIIISQEVTGLENGSYTVVLYANAMYTPDRGVARAEDMANGATDVAYVFANDAKTRVAAQNATSTSKNGEYSIDVVVTDGKLNLGIAKDKGGVNWLTIQIKSLTFHKEAVITDEMVQELISTIPTGKMSKDAQTAIDNAKKALLDKKSDANYTALSNAINAARASVNTYAAAETALAGMGALVDGTNVYGEGYVAYANKYKDLLAKYNDGTLNEAVVNPEVFTGWHASTDYNFLLTPWTIGGEKANNFDKPLYINTWSVEGDTDGSNFHVPFFEYWTGDANSLEQKELATVIPGLDPSKTYSVDVWTRVRIKNGATGPQGITFKVGNGKAVNACAGESPASRPEFFIINLKAKGQPDANGNLKVAFNVAADNNISWLSYRDVYYEETLPMEVETSFLNGAESNTLNDHSEVSVDMAEALRVSIMNAPEAVGASYTIYGMKSVTSEEGTSWIADLSNEIKVGESTSKGNAFFSYDEPIYFEQGNKYQVNVTVYGNYGFDPEEIGSYTYIINGSYVEPVEAHPSFIAGEEEYAINNHGEATIRSASAIKVNVTGAPNAVGISYAINEMKAVSDEEGTTWVPDESKDLAVGESNLNGVGYAEFGKTINFLFGSKYQLKVTVYGMDGEEIETLTYIINGSTPLNYDLPAEINVPGTNLDGVVAILTDKGTNYTWSFPEQEKAVTSDVQNFYRLNYANVKFNKFEEEVPGISGGNIYTIQVVNADGEPIEILGSDENSYLNTEAGGWTIFAMGLKEHKYGQYCDFGGLWQVEYDREENAYTIQNVARILGNDPAYASPNAQSMQKLQYVRLFSDKANYNEDYAAETFMTEYENLQQQFTQVYNSTVNSKEYSAYKYIPVIEELNPVLNAIAQNIEEKMTWAIESMEAGTLFNDHEEIIESFGGIQNQMTMFINTFNGAIADMDAEIADATLEPGDYTLMNVATGRYLNGANAWGTKASATEHGQYMTLAKLEDGKYTIDSHYSNGGNNHFVNQGDNLFLDGAAVGHVFECVGRNAWTIKDPNGKYLNNQTDNIVNFNATEVSDNTIWVLVSKADLIKNMSEIKEGSIDVTALIGDANFSRNNQYNSKWEGDKPGINGANYNNGTFFATGFNAEKWGGNSQTFATSQTIANIPNGEYILKAQGYYRYNNTTANTNDVAAAAHADGTEAINSYLYANNTKVGLKSIADETSVEIYGKMPFSQTEAAEAFSAGAYNNELKVFVNDGMLTIGIKKIEHPGCDWTVWDNFALYYNGETEAYKANNNIAEEFAMELEGLQNQWTMVYNTTVNNSEYSAKYYQKTIEEQNTILKGISDNITDLQTWGEESYNAGTLATDVEEILGSFENIQIQLTQFLNSFKGAIDEAYENRFKGAKTELTRDMFHEWTSYEAGAEITGAGYSEGSWGVSAGTVYGDPGVHGNQYADLTDYNFLALTFTEGTPRLLLNRQSNDDKSPDFIEIKDASNQYVTVVDNVWYIDLTKITADKGYAHLNVIKGANWANVNITEASLISNDEEPMTFDIAFDVEPGAEINLANSSSINVKVTPSKEMDADNLYVEGTIYSRGMEAPINVSGYGNIAGGVDIDIDDLKEGAYTLDITYITAGDFAGEVFEPTYHPVFTYEQKAEEGENLGSVFFSVKAAQADPEFDVTELNGKVLIITDADKKNVLAVNHVNHPGGEQDAFTFPVADLTPDHFVNSLFTKVTESGEEGDNIYSIRYVDDAGEPYIVWGWAGSGYLNFQPTGSIIFALEGMNAQYGQDGPNCALWRVTKEAEGYSIQNVGNGKYLNPAASVPSDEKVIVKLNNVPAKFEYTVDPTSGSEFAHAVSEITLNFTEDTGIGNGMIVIKKDGEEIAKVDAEAVADPEDYFAPVTQYTVAINAKENGIYTVEIPEGYFYQAESDLSSPAITLTYTISMNAEDVTDLDGEMLIITDLDKQNVLTVNHTEHPGGEQDVFTFPVADLTPDHFVYSQFTKVTDSGEEGDNIYAIRFYNEAGEVYNVWGWEGSGYLNFQPNGSIIFALEGMNAQYGQDGKNCALWRVTKEAEGYVIKNVGNGKYLNPASSNPSSTKVYVKLNTDLSSTVKDELTREMFHEWTSYEAGAEIVGAGGCGEQWGVSSDCPYGNASVLGNNYADLSEYKTLALTVTEGTPRLLFNRQSNDGSSPDFLEINNAGNEYVTVVDKVWYFNLEKITADKGYAHLNVIKGANWQKVTITEAILTSDDIETAPVAIESVETATKANGKYMENGKVIIIRNGVKYNMGGQILK